MKIKDIPLFLEAELIAKSKLSTKTAIIVTDNRLVKKGDVFIAIKGANFDGHSFIDDKLAKSASLIVVNRSWYLQKSIKSGTYAIVDNTVDGMVKMASAYLKKLSIPVVAVTGSNGKTTTRAMISTVLSGKYSVFSSKGNYNNRIGLPLSVFSITKKHNIAVLEMGTNHFGEISELSICAKPDTSVITNIGRSHLEFLENRNGVLRAKLEIVDGMKVGGNLVVNGDDDLLLNAKIKNGITKRTVGFSSGGFIKGAKFISGIVSGSSFTASSKKVKLQIPGRGAATDALIALAVGKIYGVPLEDGAAKLAKLTAPENRMEVKVINGVTVISDCYNANPDSMVNVLTLLGEDKSFKRKIAVLGTMGELGKKSKTFHREIGKIAANSGIDVVLAVGTEATTIVVGAKSNGLINTHPFKDVDEVIPVIIASLRTGDALLIKGSHSIKLEKIYSTIIEGKKR